MSKKSLKGSSLVGSTPSRGRVEDDFYATPLSATKAIFEREPMDGLIWEPACGDGAISKFLIEQGKTVISSDLVDRGYGIAPIDFLTIDPTEKEFNHDVIITNPPFSLAQQFIEKALSFDNTKVIMFCKIQLLEGKARKEMFLNSPLKCVYVFSERQNPLRNGQEYDENGKKWSSTMCFAWFVWDKTHRGKPTIEWI